MTEPLWPRTTGVLAVAALALVAGGCERPAPETAPGQARSPAAALSTEASPSGVQVTVVDRPAYDRLLEKHRGQVVLVDFWATWCLPCVEQLGHTVKVARDHRDQGLAVMSVSMNDPTEREAIEALLQRKEAGDVENLVSEYGSGPRSMEEFEIAGGALPHYKLYDRAGKLRFTFAVDPSADKQFTPEEVEARVEELLAE
jgi:thiol-disulfide isomerase/thioredoxin